MAKRFFVYMLKHYVFWMALFAIARLLFILWNREELTGIPFTHILFAFVKGLYVDTAMACYLLVFPFLFAVIASLTGSPKVIRFGSVIHGLLFFAFFLLTLSELSIYDEWHTKLNYKALWFFGNPSEVFHTASTTQTFSVLFFSIAGTVLAQMIYRKFFREEFQGPRSNVALIAAILIIPALLMIGIRGGFYTIPIQLSDAYYSKYNVLNLASLNSPFNLASSCIENAKAGEPYSFLSSTEANSRFEELQKINVDSSWNVLTTPRPNIVLVVLEGWSADMIQSLGGIRDVSIAPNFDSLCRDGISFSNCYASGSLSDQGMAAVFSAFPAQPLTSIITQPNKYVKLPCINKKLKADGYHTSFMFGGQLSYGNIRSYMYFNEFDKIIEGADFPSEIPQGKLGAHDQFLFDRQLQELRNEQQPFFAAMFTLSTHGPYDFPPGARDLNYGDKEEDYVNSVHYADSCIGDFIRRAREEPWYNNTLFVFISDHSHNSPLNYPFTSPEYRRIPWLFYGNVVDSNYRGKKIDVTVSQTDLAATLLGQLHLDFTDFKFSKNQFNSTAKHFAYYSFEEGLGYVEDDASIVWSVDGRGTYHRKESASGRLPADQDSLYLLKNGQTILQTLSVDYAQY